MRITEIICGRDSVRVLTDAEDGERLTVCAFVPLINGKEKKRELRYPGRRVFSCEADVHGGCLTVPRFPGYAVPSALACILCSSVSVSLSQSNISGS